MPKKRRKPVDIRKTPYVRAHMEVAKARGLKEGSVERLAHMIFWDCAGDFQQVEKWFSSPKLDNARVHWDKIQAYMIDENNLTFLLELYEDTERLYELYSNLSN